MLADEVVYGGLIDGRELCELQAHADAAFGPRDSSLGVDVLRRARKPESHLHVRTRLERIGGPDRKPAVADVQRERRRDRVAKPIRDRDAEHDAWTRAAIVLLGKQMRRKRGHDVLNRSCIR